MKKNLIFDFDSTIVKSETLDILAAISLNKDPQKEKKINSITLLTNQAMEGKISFPEALDKRLKLLNITKKDIKKTVQLLIDDLSESIKINLNFFKNNKDSIYVVSGGFKEIIIPVTKILGIPNENVFGNSFIYNKNVVIGIDKNNLISMENGKSKLIESLKLNGIIVMIGDGYTDYEVKLNSIADYFIAYIENIKRDNVCALGDDIAKNISDVKKYIKKYNIWILSHFYIVACNNSKLTDKFKGCQIKIIKD